MRKLKIVKPFALNRKRTIAVIGADGMLGSEVYSYFTALSKKTNSAVGTVWKISRDEYDFSYPAEVSRYFDSKDNMLPDIFINCAAFTDTNAIQTTHEGYLKGFRSNVVLPRLLAQACAKHRIKFVHVSTDYVNSEYTITAEDSNVTAEDSNVYEFPVNTYGLQKLLGEKYVESEYAEQKSDNYLIVRTSWLFGPNSKHKTFPEKITKKIIELAAAAVQNGNKEQLLDVDVATAGYPTSTWYLSSFIANALEIGLHGTVDGFQPTTTTSPSSGEKLPALATSSRVDVADKVMAFFGCDVNVPHADAVVTINPCHFGNASSMHHPAALPTLIARGNCTEDYVRCQAAAASWENHLSKFM